MKLYCGFRLSDTINQMVHRAQELAAVEAPLELVPKDRIHVTTAFLGEMDEQKAVRILKAAANVGSFYAYVGVPSTFPNVLYLSVTSSGAHKVRDAQAAAYCTETGKRLWPDNYQPHVTLAKCENQHKNAGKPKLFQAIERISCFNAGSTLVEQLHLFNKSEIIATIDLKEAESWI